jgi:hypothetical protein
MCASWLAGHHSPYGAASLGILAMLRGITPMDQVYSYVTSWKEGKVCQMFIQKVTPEWQECGHQYVAIALNPETNKSMVMSKPRSHYDTLQWVRRFCGSFSLLY